MYQEWMDAMPLLVPGCHHHNATELVKAEEYYKKNNNQEMADYYHKQYLKELDKIKNF